MTNLVFCCSPFSHYCLHRFPFSECHTVPVHFLSDLFHLIITSMFLPCVEHMFHVNSCPADCRLPSNLPSHALCQLLSGFGSLKHFCVCVSTDHIVEDSPANSCLREPSSSARLLPYSGFLGGRSLLSRAGLWVAESPSEDTVPCTSHSSPQHLLTTSPGSWRASRALRL